MRKQCRFMLGFLMSFIFVYQGFAQNNALQFSGTSDYVDCGTNTKLNITSSMTVELWIRPSRNLGDNRWDRIVHRNYQTGYFFGGKAGSPNALTVVLNNNLGILTTPNNTVTLNEWQHIAFVFNDAADSVKIFRNGLEVAGARYTGTITGGSHNFTLSESGVEKFAGAMDEVRIWNVARTQAQIQANMSTTVSASSSGLVAYYGFNHGTAGGTNTGVTTLTDLTSNVLNGTLYNFTLSGTSSNWVTSTALSTLSNNANLSALTTTAGTLSPTFSASTTAYTASVSNATTSVTVTPTRAEANATIQVRVNNGTYSAITSGSASAALALNVGSNTIDVRVTAQDGNTIKTYTITVTRASSISSNADLSGLTISAGTLNPSFNSSNTSYSVSVGNASSTVTVTPTRAESNATIQVRVNGGSYSTVTSGTTSGNLAVNVGSNTIDVLVTAQDGTTTKTYSIQVIRAQSSNANLTALTISSGTLSPTFAINTTSYTATVSNATSEITLTATLQEVNAGSSIRVVLNGGAGSFITSGVASSNLPLNIGNNTIVVVVTAEDGVTTKTYTITVTRTALAPAITSFTPLAATPGDVVVISGAHFNTTTTNNIVYFGATAATVTDATATSLTVQVPQGATFAPISILNTATSLVGTSLQKFNPVFSPAKSAFSSTDLASKVDFTAGSSPRGCAFADIDGDGKAEIIVTNFSSNNIGVFRNTSNGSGAVTYAAMVTFSTGTSTLAIAINDIDNDRKLDVVTLNLSGSISVLRNTSTSGSISFATKVDAAVGGWPLGIAVGDVDGDGKADIVTANYNDNNFSIVRNTSTPGSISLATHTTFSTASGPSSVAISDIDGNGVVDVVIGNQDNNSVSVFRNTSSVGSLSFAARVNFNTATAPVWIATGDIDNDGKLDIVSANQSAKSISILRSTSTSGTVTFATKIDVATDPATSAAPNFIALGDMNGDNKLDVVVSIDGIDKVSFFRSTSTSGNISFATRIDFGTGSNPWSVAVGDADNDGKSDIAVVNRVSNSFSILRNTDIPVWNGTSWSPSAPSSTVDAIIASSTAPASFTAKGLTINSGVSLNTTGITATLNGDITNNGDGISGTGNVVIAATSALLGNNISFLGTLTVNTGATLTTNGKLQLASSATNTGMIGNSSGTISGSVTVERYLPSGRRRNVFLSSAVTARIDTSWQQQIHITGSGTGGTICPTLTPHSNGFDATLNNTPSMFTYNPTAAAGNRWVSVANTNATNLTPGTGYRVIYRGNRTQGCSLLDGTNTAAQATTISAKGVLAQGNISITLQPGFNLLGNPYASPINFATVQSDNSTNVENSYWAYFAPASAATPNYSVYSAGDTSNFPTAYANPSILASGQAVFVKTKPAVVSATVVSNFFREAQKSTTTQNGQFRTQNTWLGRVRTQLLDTDGNVVDAALVRFSSDSEVSNATIGALDAQSLNSSALHLSTIKAGERFSIQTRTAIPQQGDTVTCFVHATNNGTYQLRWSELQIGSNNAILIDKFLNQQQAITEGDSYSFTTTSDPASKGNRFDVVFRSSATLPTNFTAIYAKAKEGNKAADVLWTVASDKQVVQYQVERSTDGRSYKAVGNVASQQSNQTVSYSYTDNQAISTVVYYRVKAMAADGSYKYSAVAKLNGKTSSIELSLYPNPVQSQLQVQLSQPVKGQLTARMVDSKGQVVYQQGSINLAGSNLLQLSVAHLPQGTYQLTLTNGSDFTATGNFVK